MARKHSRKSPMRTSPSGRWWLFALAGAGVLAVVAWVAIQGLSSPAPATAGRAQVATVGALAPSIPLPATTGGQVSLEQYRGSKVVVYFYEGAG